MERHQLFYDKSPVGTVDELLSHFAGNALQSAFRSTVPLLDMAIHARAQLMTIVTRCGGESDAELRFEYQVASTADSAHASHTDLMAIGAVNAVAVEAKWTEPAYDTVEKRLARRTAKTNRDASPAASALDRARQEIEVSAWVQRLQPYSATPLLLSGMRDVVYQMIHRAASAVGTGKRPALLYLHFNDLETKQGAGLSTYRADLARLRETLGRPPGFRFYVAEQEIARTDVFRKIQGLSKHESATCARVREALKAGPLFTYGAATIEAIE